MAGVAADMRAGQLQMFADEMNEERARLGKLFDLAFR